MLDLLGAVALLVTAIAVIPQTVRLLRVGSTQGVSPTWAMLGAVSTAVWTAYTAARGLWWASVADALSCGGYVVTVVLLARHGEPARILAGLGWFAVFVAAGLVARLDGVGAVLAVAFIVQVTPSLWTAYRTLDLVGASLATWLLVFVEGVLWFAYGIGVADGAVIAFGAIAATTGILMSLRIGRLRRSHPQPDALIDR